MPLALSVLLLFILVIQSPPQTVKEGDMPSFVLRDLGLALVAKTYPDRPQALLPNLKK